MFTRLHGCVRGLVGCQPSSVAINFLDHVTKWAPHGGADDTWGAW